MTMFYSKTTGGFYDSAIHGSNVPPDAVTITQAQHDALMLAQSNGKVIGADASGNPIATDPPPLTGAAAWAAKQTAARAALAESDLTMLRCIEKSVTVPAAWATYRDALRAIISATSGDGTTALPARPAYPAGT